MPNHYTMHLIVSVIVNKSKNGGKKISGRYVVRTWATSSSVKFFLKNLPKSGLEHRPSWITALPPNHWTCKALVLIKCIRWFST